ncbi:alpha/beta fold hydrolase [Cyanobium sp. Cruz CV13-4-11]|uniref:alpha/beta fold hydrolase n=1 Tax=unclassified Cyanobium TaxID=2627006 RepID=UPI0020CC8303|nr:MULTISPECIES: alpha/beta fold hydrolase [unclassified Cyanobium]MCP9901591.1 alpha/beta fold hydrolase [Cyanobium sp. Cruz CV11-17]MCP9918602.1 alpha/beta fold hydrolase [Cyanobium sp. Cruz CV13-4-11]
MSSADPQPAPGEAAPQQGADWGDHARWDWRGHGCHWRRLGPPDGPALVLLHGFGAASGHWRRNAGPLAAAGWCVYGLDLIGFGASSQPGLDRHQALDNRLWSRQVQAFLAEVVQGPAVLVGHSLGGLVALTCSVYAPLWVRAVVAAPLPDPSLLMAGRRPPRRPPWRRRLKRGVIHGLLRLLPLELVVPLLAHSPLLDLGIQSAYRHPVIGDQELRRLIARPARRPGAVRALRAMSIGMALRPFRATAVALLQQRGRPTLLIWGAQDRLVPVEVSQQCLRLRADLDLHVVPSCGHCPHDETPDAFHGVVLSWLERLPTG